MWKFQITARKSEELIKVIPKETKKELTYQVFKGDTLMMAFRNFDYAMDYAYKIAKK